MTPKTFLPCAAFARDTLSIPPILYTCERRPPTKAALKAASAEWARRIPAPTRSHTVSLGDLRVYVQMQRIALEGADGIETRPTFWVGLSKAGVYSPLIPMAKVAASPIDTLPARLHAAACALLAAYATRLEAQAAALTEEAAAVRALLPTPEPA